MGMYPFFAGECKLKLPALTHGVSPETPSALFLRNPASSITNSVECIHLRTRVRFAALASALTPFPSPATGEGKKGRGRNKQNPTQFPSLLGTSQF